MSINEFDGFFIGRHNNAVLNIGTYDDELAGFWIVGKGDRPISVGSGSARLINLNNF